MTNTLEILNNTLNFISKKGSSNGILFLNEICAFLSNELEVDYVLISKYDVNTPNLANSIVFYGNKTFLPNVAYKLENTPCDNVLNGNFCAYTDQLQIEFPKDDMLQELGVQSYAGTPLFNSDSNPIGIIAIMHSKKIKDPKTIECVLKTVALKIEKILEQTFFESENKKLLTAVEQSENTVIITDIKGNIEYVNPKFTQLTGYTFSEVQGKNPRILSSHNQSKEFYTELWKTLTNGKTWKGKFQNKTKSGSYFWEQSTITPILDEEGKIVNFLAVKEDITERIKNEEELRKANELIKDKENQLATILKTANEGFWIIDNNGITTECNIKLCSILEYTESEIVGKSIYNFVDESNSKIFKNQLSQRNKGIATSYEIELLTKSGKSIPCLFNTSPLYNKTNEKIGSFAMVTDVSILKNVYKKLENNYHEQKQLSFELSEKNRMLFNSNSKYKNLFEKSPVSLWEVDFYDVKQLFKNKGIEIKKLKSYFDENQDFLLECISIIEIVKVNKSTLNLFGVKNRIELIKHLNENNLTNSFNNLKKELLAVLSNKKRFKSETKFIRTDGKIISTIFESEIDSFGKAIVSVIDVTAIKDAEKKLLLEKEKAEISDERYRLAVSTISLGIWDWDIVANKVYLSDHYKWQIGYSPNEIEDNFSIWEEHLHPDDYEKAVLLFNNYQKNPVGKYKSEFRFRHKNGNYIWILSRAGVLKNGKGEVIRMFGSHRDITVRKNALLELESQKIELIKAKEKAEESNKLKTEFLNNMSHEIRTPMNGILGFSNFLGDPSISNSKRDYFVKIIQNCGNQLLHIIDDILEISNLETKQVKVIEKPVCLNDFLMELFSVFNLRAKENKVSLYLEKNLSDDESTIFCDKSKLSKIISNLLDNAIKYTNEGKIVFGYKQLNGDLELFVEDTGIGIKLDKQEIIFERFSREEKDISKSVGGLGLGLSIAKENTELLKGQISVESENGMGSIFKVLLPYKPVNTVSKVTHFTDKKQTILIVEDDEVNFMLLELLFIDKINSDFTILHAINGQEAVDICRKNNTIDIVFMDIQMPVLNGYEAFKKIKEFKPNLPIIAQTAYSSIEDKEKAFNAGFDEFIAKPISIDKLKNIMKHYLVENIT